MINGLWSVFFCVDFYVVQFYYFCCCRCKNIILLVMSRTYVAFIHKSYNINIHIGVCTWLLFTANDYDSNLVNLCC